MSARVARACCQVETWDWTKGLFASKPTGGGGANARVCQPEIFSRDAWTLRTSGSPPAAQMAPFMCGVRARRGPQRRARDLKTDRFVAPSCPLLLSQSSSALTQFCPFVDNIRRAHKHPTYGSSELGRKVELAARYLLVAPSALHIVPPEVPQVVQRRDGVAELIAVRRLAETPTEKAPTNSFQNRTHPNNSIRSTASITCTPRRVTTASERSRVRGSMSPGENVRRKCGGPCGGARVRSIRWLKVNRRPGVFHGVVAVGA